MSKLTLQIVMGLLGIIPVATGLLGLLGVEDPFYVAVGVPPIVLLDTNLRFYSGVWLGLGLALYGLIPSICRTIEINLKQHLGEVDLPAPIEPVRGVLGRQLLRHASHPRRFPSARSGQQERLKRQKSIFALRPSTNDISANPRMGVITCKSGVT